MSNFIVVKIDGDVPKEVAMAGYHAFSGVLSAWNELAGTVEQESFVELLGFGDETEPGPARRRHSVLERQYAKRDEPKGDD